MYLIHNIETVRCSCNIWDRSHLKCITINCKYFEDWWLSLVCFALPHLCKMWQNSNKFIYVRLSSLLFFKYFFFCFFSYYYLCFFLLLLLLFFCANNESSIVAIYISLNNFWGLIFASVNTDSLMQMTKATFVTW